MRRVYVFLIAVTCLTLMAGCGSQPANNASVNTNTRAANSNANAVNAAPADTASAEADIRKLLDTTAAALAKNDTGPMESVYADNYMLINTDGSVQNKSERLASLRSGEVKYSAFSYSEPSIRINPEGNGAVVIAKLNMKGTFKGKVLDGDYRVLHVYSKMKDGWKLVSATAVPITGASMPAANANTNAMSAPANANSKANSNR